MSQRTIYRCDVCGEERQLANHWFAVFIEEEPRHFSIYPFHEMNSDQRVAVTVNERLDAKHKIKKGQTVLHLCGESCATKKFAEFLGSVNRPNGPQVFTVQSDRGLG